MNCYLCDLNFENIGELIQHLKTDEKLQEYSKNFNVKCPYSDCGKCFTTFYGLKTHVLKNHSHKISNQSSKRALSPVELSEINSFKKQCTLEPTNKSFDDVMVNLNSDVEQFFTNLFEFAIPEEQQNLIANHFLRCVDTIKNLTTAALEENINIPSEAVEIAFQSASDVIKKFKSKHKRKNFFSNSKLYVAPEEKSLKTRIESVYNSNLGLEVDKSVQSTYQYVPMKHNLCTLFGMESFKSAFFNSKNHVCTPGIYYNVCCGSNVMNGKFFKDNPNAVLIELYYDEVEPCDGMKQSAGIHKLGQFYYRIKNLDPSIQTQWSNIYLLASFYYIDLAGDVNINSILSQIREEICDLEEHGIDVPGYGNIKATVVSTVHDNLGAHMIYHMVLGFNSKYFCRFCKISLEESKVTATLNVSLNRIGIKSELENLMKDIEPDSVLDHHTSVGFKGFSELHHLQHFKMEEASSVDPLHDLLEGVVPRDLMLVFQYMMKNMKIKEADLKTHINTFKYGSISSSHKPVNINFNKESGALGLSAMQVKTLIFHFPFIFGHYFKSDEEKSVFEFVHDLLQITTIAFKHVVTDDDVAQLEVLIQKHLHQTIKFFNRTLTRKHHFLLHYPSVIRRLGPTSLMSTAPYEHKHIFFTRLIRKTSINKNIIKTVVHKHQLAMAIDSDDRFQHKMELGRVSTPKMDEAVVWRQKFQLPTNQIEQISWIKFGYHYTPSYFILHNKSLIEISNIIRQDQKIFIIGNEYEFKNDETSASLTLNNVIDKVIIDFDEIKLLPTFNKILSSNDKKFHVILLN